ncbi:CRISPR-associated autoregulator, Csa2 family [Candidatus Fervidibacteria bacterium JGI MDM2 SSWTFF-3-K9]
MAEQKQEQVFEIAIVGRVTWNLHSLNNEGTIGNVTEPRTVVLWDGTKTDGVSGEMMKHIHAFWTWLQARENNLRLCSACQSFQPQRADAASRDLPSGRGQEADAMAQVLQRCVLCDLHGFLVQRPTIHRQSTVEFGWVVGVPEQIHRDLHIHARHAIGAQGMGQEETVSEGEVSGEEMEQARPEVTAQMLYHRPTRSGVYAFVTLFQAWRIGLNEVNYTYALNDDNDRKKRYELALTAYEWTFKRPDGAMTTTRLPHIEGAEGLVLVAKTAVPVPLLSPLRDDYRQQLKDLAQKQGIEVYGFDDLAKLTEILTELRQLSPFRINAPSQQ